VVSKQISLYSWNVNGIRAVHKKGFVEWLQTEQPDILGLQESKISSDQLTFELKTPVEGYTSYWSHAEKRGYSGTTILTKLPPLSVREGLGIAEFDTEGRVLVAEYPWFTFYTIYYPNGKRDSERLQYKLGFYEAFLTQICELRDKGRPVVFCGDVNTAHHPIDLARPKENVKVSGFLPEERVWLDKWVAEGFVDTFRYFHPETPEQYTWWDQQSRARERNKGWRIDYFFVSESLKSQLMDARIHADVMGSDHCPVSITLSVDEGVV
jgi:exodeoxyribonuclease III